MGALFTSERATMTTKVARVATDVPLGRWGDGKADGVSDLESWVVEAAPGNDMALAQLRDAGERLRTTDHPVAFPTETVYGLGADATRSAAVRGIYTAKGRPSDNPLIVHVSDLAMLRRLLTPQGQDLSNPGPDDTAADHELIPAIYRPVIQRFWPGPLTILLPSPQPSRLAPEVTAGLPTFGCRMPSSPLARTLIQLAGAPLAAPSANASTKPSPTAARHVLDDLAGRIPLILDGGACQVGVESTVVDGLCDPPVVLRPGGVSIAELATCPGWECVEKAYRDEAETGKKAAPRAPGMKYKHYSPKAKVVLYEAGFAEGAQGVTEKDLEAALQSVREERIPTIGIVRTQRWSCLATEESSGALVDGDEDAACHVRQNALRNAEGLQRAKLLDIALGKDVKGVAQGLFSALRELDRHGADVIFVEGVGDGDGMAAAVMNRLRKAASEIRS